MSLKTPQSSMQGLWTVFRLICLSILISGLVGFLWLEPSQESHADLVLPVALFFTFCISLFTAFVQKFIKISYTNICLLKWGLIQSIGVFGIIIYLLTGNTTYLGGFILYSLALMSVHAPKKSYLEDS